MSNPNFNPTLSSDEIWRGTNSNRCLSDDLDVLGVEDTTYPGCYYRSVDGVTEWINPPMIAGTEYRTTERWGGKPVYIKMLSCGAMPNKNTTRNVGHGISNMEYIVDFGGVMTRDGSGAISLPYYFASENQAWISVTNENFVIVSGSNDISSYNDVRLWIKYTKKI